MLVLAGTIGFDPAHTEAAKHAAAKMMAATWEEPGNIEYCFAIDMADESTVRVFEVWESQEALDAHFETPHMVEFRAALAGFGITSTEISRYEISSHGPFR